MSKFKAVNLINKTKIPSSDTADTSSVSPDDMHYVTQMTKMRKRYEEIESRINSLIEENRSF